MARIEHQQRRYNGMVGLMLRTALSPDEVRRYVQQARNPNYWRKLNPQLTVSDKFDSGKVRARAITTTARRTALARLEDEGYCQLDSVYPDAMMKRIRQGIENLAKANWPTVFIYAYDECWLMKRIPSFVALMDSILGPDHMELRNNWAHYIRPVPGAHGWIPHMDGPFLDGRASAWFPITDATLDNGCIYIIPQNRIPRAMADSFRRARRYTSDQFKLLLQNARALPVRAGSILVWNFRTIHWGSTVGHTKEPRISVATEFVSTQAPGFANDASPLEAHSSIPPFDVRLQVIGRGVSLFPGFEPKLLRYREVAQQLWTGEESAT